MVSAATDTCSTRLPTRQRRRRLGAVALGVAIAMSAVGGSATGSAGAALPVSELHAAPAAVPANAPNDVINAANRYRRNSGIPTLVRSSALSQAAQRHANDMAAMGRMTHTGSDGSNVGGRVTAAGFFWRSVGENIAAGQRTAEQVTSAWMNSAGHRANILNRGFQYIGVGATERNGVIYWCMVLVGR